MCFKMNRPATSRVGKPGCPDPAWQRTEALIQDVPFDQCCQPHQRMTHVDDLIERLKQQVFRNRYELPRLR